MDGAALKTQLMQSLAMGLKQLVDDRAETNSGYRYAELTGRMEAMRTMLDFLQEASLDPCANCQAVKDGSKKEPEVGENQPKPKRKKKGAEK